MAVSYRTALIQTCDPANIALLRQQQLMELAVAMWSDVECAGLLGSNEAFVWECVKRYSERGYLLASEEQDLRRVFAAINASAPRDSNPVAQSPADLRPRDGDPGRSGAA
jgi:hypothetical protein